MGNRFTYRTLSDVEKKNLVILDSIRKDGPISRSELSKRLEINPVSISNYVKHYIGRGLVFETGLEVSSGGRRPELLELNSRGGFELGISIGPSDIIAVLTDLNAKSVDKSKTKYSVRSSGEVGSMIQGLVKELINKSKITAEKVKGIGIGISAVLNLEWDSMAELLEKDVSIPVYLTQDAMCAAYGEKRLSPKADVDNMLYMHSDIGCGIVLVGDIYLGASGDAGEISLSPQDLRDKEELSLRDSTYLKPWSSDLGIVAEAKRVISRGVGTEIVNVVKGNIDGITMDAVIEAVQRNDEVARSIIEVAAMNLGLRIAYLVNIFNPEVVVIGGGIEKAGDLVVNSIKRSIDKYSLSRPAGVVKLISSDLGEEAVSLGAASLVTREVFITSYR